MEATVNIGFCYINVLVTMFSWEEEAEPVTSTRTLYISGSLYFSQQAAQLNWQSSSSGSLKILWHGNPGKRILPSCRKSFPPGCGISWSCNLLQPANANGIIPQIHHTQISFGQAERGHQYFGFSGRKPDSNQAYLYWFNIQAHLPAIADGIIGHTGQVTGAWGSKGQLV